MTALLSTLPKHFQEAAKSHIQQGTRSNTSGNAFNANEHLKYSNNYFLGTNSPSSPSPKPLLSPQQYGQYSTVQSHVSSEFPQTIASENT